MTIDIEKNRLACARAYVAAGFYVFHLRGKVPQEEGWNVVPWNAEQDLSWLKSSYAVRLTDEVFVIDADPRHYAYGVDELDAFLQMTGLPPFSQINTYIVKSGGEPVQGYQGYHLYFTKPEGVNIKRSIKGLKGIEIKSIGQFVLGAGSIHPKTKNVYEIHKGWMGEISQAPDTLLEFLQQDSIAERVAHEGFDDSEANKKRYISFLMATPEAIETQGGDHRTFVTACEGRDYGLSPQVVFALLNDYYNPRCQPPWDEDELQAKVDHAFSYGQNVPGSKNTDEFTSIPELPDILANYNISLQRATNKGVPATLGNIVQLLRAQIENGKSNPFFRMFRFNEFTKSPEFMRRADWHVTDKLLIDDEDLIQMMHWFSVFKRLNASKETMLSAILVVSRDYTHHPIRNWLNGLVWDRKPRLNKMLTTYAGVFDTPYVQEVSKNTMIGAVARIFTPGCKHDYMLVLEGDQGNGKTTFVQTLGGEWYADVMIDPRSKDTVQGMLGQWILEASELDFMAKTDVTAIRRFLTIKADKVRLPYDRTQSTLPRSSIFIGTVNRIPDAGYLNDPAGHRRFWPVKTNIINIPALKRDRDQLFAEATYRFKKGENAFITDATLIEAAKIEQKSREQVDEWSNVIQAWLHSPNSPKKFTVSDMAYEALNLMPKDLDKPKRNRIGAIIRELGYIQCQWRIKGFMHSGWKIDDTDL